MIPVVIHGAEGRMGRLVTDLVEEAPDFALAGLVSEPGRDAAPGDFHPRLPLLGQDRLADALPAQAVVIDFSLADALDGLLDQLAKHDGGLVVGTTGFDAAQVARLTAFAGYHPVVRASNFSIGIPTLRMLLQLLARTLPGGFDAAQVETHHVTKKDRPSGTAASLAEAYREIRGGEEVPTHSLRLGGVVGEHTWTFSDDEETLVLTHRAHSRRAFLRGILPAVRFVAGREAGLFDLGDVLRAAEGPHG